MLPRVSRFLRFSSTQKHSTRKANGSRTRDVDVEHLVGDVEDRKLREELCSCQHFLVDSELERARHKIFNYVKKTFDERSVDEKFDFFFKKLKCAAKVNLAFKFILETKEDGLFRYFYAYENNTLLDRLKLVYTRDDLPKQKDLFNKIDDSEKCSREKMSTNWKFYKLANLTDFAALSKYVPIGCKNAVLIDPPLVEKWYNQLSHIGRKYKTI